MKRYIGIGISLTLLLAPAGMALAKDSVGLDASLGAAADLHLPGTQANVESHANEKTQLNAHSGDQDDTEHGNSGSAAGMGKDTEGAGEAEMHASATSTQHASSSGKGDEHRAFGWGWLLKMFSSDSQESISAGVDADALPQNAPENTHFASFFTKLFAALHLNF